MWKFFRILSKCLTFILPNFLFNILWRCLDIFDGRFGAAIRYILISGRLKSCGDRVYFGPSVYIESVNKLKLGHNVSIHHGCTLICLGGIKIGDNVAIAHSSSLISTNHTWDNLDIPIKYNPIVKGEIVVESDVWLGCAVRVLAGSYIHSRVVVAANGVISGKKLESNSIYGGIPCKLLKKI